MTANVRVTRLDGDGNPTGPSTAFIAAAARITPLVDDTAADGFANLAAVTRPIVLRTRQVPPDVWRSMSGETSPRVRRAWAVAARKRARR